MDSQVLLIQEWAHFVNKWIVSGCHDLHIEQVIVYLHQNTFM